MRIVLCKDLGRYQYLRNTCDKDVFRSASLFLLHAFSWIRHKMRTVQKITKFYWIIVALATGRWQKPVFETFTDNAALFLLFYPPSGLSRASVSKNEQQNE